VGTHLSLSAGTAICSAASALVYSIAALEMTWRLGGTGAGVRVCMCVWRWCMRACACV